MKKIRKIPNKIFLISAVFGLIFAGCNTSVGPDEDDGTATEVIITDGGLYVLGNDVGFPGAEVDLAKLLGTGQSILDISKYASVTVDAVLYSDTEGNTIAVQGSPSDNLAQFTLLKNSGNWPTNTDKSNACAPTKYNMAVDGETIMTVPADAGGVPSVLLLQANWEGFPNAVKSIELRAITFTPKSSDSIVTLESVFGESKVVVNGNKITFVNATYSDGAAQYAFPAGFFPLEGKTLVFNFRLEDHDEALEHQIHIQAAKADAAKDKFNGRDTQPGQKYITLDDPDGDYDQATGTGSFTVSCDDLISASQVSGNASDINGPFELNAVRIVNNGTFWNGDGKDHDREKSYSIIFQSITVQ